MANNGSQMTYSGDPYPYKHLNWKTTWCKYLPNCTKPPPTCPGAHSQSERSKGVQRSECLQRLIDPHPTRSSQVTPSLLVDHIIRFIRDKASDKKTMECGLGYRYGPCTWSKFLVAVQFDIKWKPKQLCNLDSRLHYDGSITPGRIFWVGVGGGGYVETNMSGGGGGGYVETDLAFIALEDTKIKAPKTMDELSRLDEKWTAGKLQAEYPEMYQIEMTVNRQTRQLVEQFASTWGKAQIKWIHEGEDLSYVLQALWQKNYAEHKEVPANRYCHFFNNIDGKDTCFHSCTKGDHRCLLCNEKHGMFAKGQCKKLETYWEQRGQCGLSHQEIEYIIMYRRAATKPKDDASYDLAPPRSFKRRTTAESVEEPWFLPLDDAFKRTFQVQAKLSDRNFSQVHRGEWESEDLPQLGKVKAIAKVFLYPKGKAGEKATMEKEREKFQQDSQILTALNIKTNHQYVVHYFDKSTRAVSNGLECTLIMKACECDLKKYIDNLNASVENDEDAIPLSQSPNLIRMVRDLIRAYTALHADDAKICHRDVKPVNILIDFDETDLEKQTPRIKLCDFGESRMFKPLEQTNMNTVVGTVDTTGCWYAPETINGVRYGRNADLWPLGCLLHYMGTDGKFPLFLSVPPVHEGGNETAGDQLPGTVQFHVQAQKNAHDAANDSVLRQRILQYGQLHRTHPLLFDLVEKLVRPVLPKPLGEPPENYRIKIGLCNYHPSLWDTSTCANLLRQFHDEGKLDHFKTFLSSKHYAWVDRLESDGSEDFKRLIKAHLNANPHIRNPQDKARVTTGRRANNAFTCLKVCRDLLTHKEILGSKSPGAQAAFKNFSLADYEEKFVTHIKDTFPELLVKIFDITIMQDWDTERGAYYFVIGEWETQTDGSIKYNFRTPQVGDDGVADQAGGGAADQAGDGVVDL